MKSQLGGSQAGQRLDVARGVGMMGSEASLRRILATVVTSLAGDLPAIDAALQAGDVATANRLLHAIKGYMPIFGSEALIAQVVDVEELSKTGSADLVQLSYPPLGLELQGLLADVQAFLDSPA